MKLTYIMDNQVSSIDSSSLPNRLKSKNINSVHKKDSRNDKRNYQPLTVSNISKVLENILNQQISAQFQDLFSKQQTGFCRSFNTQHCLLVMLEKLCLKALDKRSVITKRSVKSI